MTKNWIGYATGMWINGQNWEEDGFCRFDPAAVVSVRTGGDAVAGCVIYFNSGGWICVHQSMDTVLSEIQSAV